MAHRSVGKVVVLGINSMPRALNRKLGTSCGSLSLSVIQDQRNDYFVTLKVTE